MGKSQTEKMREKAAKLKNPTPKELPSGMWRCQVMVNRKRVGFTDRDPGVAYAKAVAYRERVIMESAQPKSNITLAAAIDKYIEARDTVLSPSTINGYREIKRNRFPGLMQKRILDIDESDLQIAVNADAKIVSAKTIKNALGLVVAAISEYKAINIKRIRLPQRIRREHKYLDEEGIIDLFESIQGSPVEIPILLAVWLGMRRSEILGLCWDSVDFEARKIKVQRTYIKGPDGDYILRDEMKTEASRRTLDCPGYILEKLKVCPGSHQGRIFKMHPNTIYKSMKRICDQNGIDFVGIHGLRHTNATVMLSLGIVDKVAMARGGWSTDITMKQVYQHLFSSDKEDAGEKIDNFFEQLSRGINPKAKAP